MGILEYIPSNPKKKSYFLFYGKYTIKKIILISRNIKINCTRFFGLKFTLSSVFLRFVKVFRFVHTFEVQIKNIFCYSRNKISPLIKVLFLR